MSFKEGLYDRRRIKKKLSKEFQDGLKEVEEIKEEFNKIFENLTYEEFEVEYEKYLEEILEDAKKHPVKRLKEQKPKQ